MPVILGGWLVEPKNKRRGLRFSRGNPDLGSGGQELPHAVGTRQSCSISVALVLPHKGFITGPVTGEDACEKVGPPLGLPVAEGQVLKQVVA